MCYSKEVSLAVGGFIALNVGLAAWRFLDEPHPLQPLRSGAAIGRGTGDGEEPALHVAAAVDPSRWAAGVAALRGFQVDVLAGLACIALHQLFEFVAIASGDVRIYKLGLLCSIACMVFLLRSLERLEGHAGRPETLAAMCGVAALGLHMTTVEMRFTNEHFWVRGYSHTLWSVTWLVAFLYWNLRVRDAAGRSGSPVNAHLLRRSSWYVLDASFALSVLYIYGSALALALITEPDGRWAWLASCVLLGHDVYADAPSVWCVFAGLQALLLWPLFRGLRRWRADAGFTPGRPSAARRGAMLAAAVGLTLALGGVPLVLDAAAKMVTR